MGEGRGVGRGSEDLRCLHVERTTPFARSACTEVSRDDDSASSVRKKQAAMRGKLYQQMEMGEMVTADSDHSSPACCSTSCMSCR